MKFGISLAEKDQVELKSNSLMNKLGDLLSKKVIQEYAVKNDIFQKFMGMPEN